MLLPTKAKLAIVRVFASADELNDMNQIFAQWNTVGKPGEKHSFGTRAGKTKSYLFSPRKEPRAI